MARVLALVDGEHYPPVVRAALAQAARVDDVVGALLLGGREKLRGEPDYGVPLVRAGDDPAAAMTDAALRLGAERVLDLSDDPVVDEPLRLRLAAHALAARLAYAGADFELRPPPAPPLGVPALAIVGSGKRVGKTAVSAHAARLFQNRLGAGEVVVVAMGRGGPEAPEVVEGARRRPDLAALLARARAGHHAASDYLEDAALAGVTTIGCRRCGGGLAGTPYLSNVAEGAGLAAARRPGIVLLEGSGGALPPVAADRTVLVTSSATRPGALTDGLARSRLLRADLVVVTGEDEAGALREAIAGVRAELPVLAVDLLPAPLEPVAGRRVALFTTAPARVHARLAERLRADHGAADVVVIGALADRSALARELDGPAVAAADLYLVEIKAAAVDTVVEAAVTRGMPAVACDNRPAARAGEASLDEALLGLARECVAAHA